MNRPPHPNWWCSNCCQSCQDEIENDYVDWPDAIDDIDFYMFHHNDEPLGKVYNAANA